MSLAWGKKVSREFRRRVVEIARALECSPSDLMAVMAFESGQTFSPSVRNRQSGATGLIQFLDCTARQLGTTTQALTGMTPVAQLDFVERYLLQFRRPLRTLEDLYMAVLWPAAIGRSGDYVLFKRDSQTTALAYSQNMGLDRGQKGYVTKADACAPVRMALEAGLRAENAFDLVLDDDAPAA